MAALVVARLSPRIPLPRRDLLLRQAVWPPVVFLGAVVIFVGVHHWRKDPVAYASSTFAGHEYWLSIVTATYGEFKWRAPELERSSGVVIDGPDAYAGALVRMKINERGERLEDYLVNGSWNEAKRSPLERQIVFDLWREYPWEMTKTYVRDVQYILVGLFNYAVGASLALLLLWLMAPADCWRLGRLILILALFATAASASDSAYVDLPLVQFAYVGATFVLLVIAWGFPASERAALRALIPGMGLFVIALLALCAVMPEVGPDRADNVLVLSVILLLAGFTYLPDREKMPVITMQTD